jgi:hypothetical protein
MPNMQNISIENLHVGHLEVRDAINHNIAGVIFLATRFCIKARAIKKDAEYGIFGESRRRLDK